MTNIRHGLTIGIERINQDFFLSMKIVGKLTHEDYERINPLVDSALKRIDEPRINVFVDATELEGWELRAAWDDFKFGLKHKTEFKNIALVGSKKWQEYATKVGGWFISGEMKYFESSEEALTWLIK